MKNILFILFFSWSTVASGLKEVPMLEENIPATKQKKIVNDVEINKNIKEWWRIRRRKYWKKNYSNRREIFSCKWEIDWR